MEKKQVTALAVVAVLVMTGSAFAHFGMLIPSQATVSKSDPKTVDLQVSFSHPMEMVGMDMAKPKALGVMAGGSKEDLLGTLKPAQVMGKALAVYNGVIYAGAGSQVSGARIYRSSSGDSNTWTPVAPAAGTMPGAAVTGFAVFNGALYATVESEAPVQIWRSTNGSSWTSMMNNGFGNSQTIQTGGMAVFGGYLYVGAGNTGSGAQLWRSSNGTSRVQAITPGYGDTNNRKVESVFVSRISFTSMLRMQ